MEPILHITTRETWEAAQRRGVYHGDTLATEGFIHCSTPQQTARVANARFRGVTGLVLLCIDPSLVGPEVRYEESEPGQRFPHIYGPLNTGAVVNVVAFEPGPKGEFIIPTGIGS